MEVRRGVPTGLPNYGHFTQIWTGAQDTVQWARVEEQKALSWGRRRYLFLLADSVYSGVRSMAIRSHFSAQPGPSWGTQLASAGALARRWKLNFTTSFSPEEKLPSRDQKGKELGACWPSPFLFLVEFMLLERFLHFCSKYPGVFYPLMAETLLCALSVAISEYAPHLFSLCTQDLSFLLSLSPHCFLVPLT